MKLPNEATSFRRVVSVVCLIGAPLLLGAADVVHAGGGEAGIVEAITANLDRVETANLLIIASSVLFVPAFMGILTLVRERGATLVNIGVGLMLIGVIGHAVWAGAQVVLAAMIRGNVDQAQLAAAVEGSAPPSAALLVIMLMFLLGFFVGLLVLAAGLWRSRVVPRWVGAALTLVAVSVGLSGFIPAGGQIVALLGAAVMLLSFAVIGMTLLSDAERRGERPVSR